MARLVFDIETCALSREAFDDAQWEFLFREAEKQPDEAAREARRAEIRQLLNLWPLTARVVCVAMLNADTSRGQVLFLGAPQEKAGEADGLVEFVAWPSAVRFHPGKRQTRRDRRGRRSRRVCRLPG